MVVSICGLDVGVGVVEENGEVVEVEQVLHERLHREEMEGCKQRCSHAGHNVLLSLGEHVMYCPSEDTGYKENVSAAGGSSSVSPALWLFLDNDVCWVFIDCHLMVARPTTNWSRGVGLTRAMQRLVPNVGNGKTHLSQPSAVVLSEGKQS